MVPKDTEPIETATPAGMSDAAGLEGTASPETGLEKIVHLVYY